MLDRFRAFVAQAIPLATIHARAYCDWLAPQAIPLKEWITPHDLISFGGLTHAENSYTGLLAWALDPPEEPLIALACQRSLFARVGLAIVLQEPMNVCPWMPTDDGVPDLVLESREHRVIIEAKTGSREHTTPSGVMQTIGYPAAFRVNGEESIHTLFLTMDGCAPANPEAKAVTYAEVALSLAQALQGLTLRADIKGAYGMLITHWIMETLDTDARDLLTEIINSSQPLDDSTVLRGLEAIQELEAVILRRFDQ